jgi:hypothetical protein
MSGIDRRRFVFTAAAGGLGIATLGATAPVALSATDEELAYANFGVAAEFLLQDFYARITEAKLFQPNAQHNMNAGARSASEHAIALSQLLTDAGQTPALADDFEFAWPEGTFDAKEPAATAGLIVTQTLLGLYLTAAAAVSVPSYRVLYVSMAANLAQQVAALSQILSGRGTGVSFPPALDLESASDAVEALLG